MYSPSYGVSLLLSTLTLAAFLDTSRVLLTDTAPRHAISIHGTSEGEKKRWEMREVNEEGEGNESGSEDKNGEINDNEDGDE